MHCHPLVRSVRIVCVVLVNLYLANVATVTADESTSTGLATPECKPIPRQGDVVWLVSTRSVRCPSDGQPPELVVEQLRDGHWEPSNWQHLRQQSQGQRWVAYLHGNRMDAFTARHRGLQLFQKLMVDAEPSAPVHYVIWSWPSSKICGPLKDIRIKASQTDIEGYYLGWALQDLPAETEVGLIGFSFGARIITGALHLVAGGELSGRSLPEPATEAAARRPRAALLAAALDRSWIQENSVHGQAAEAAEQLLVMFNPCDRALKHYRAVEKCAQPIALGSTGTSTRSPLLAEVLLQYNVGNAVGARHDDFGYFSSRWLRQQIRDCVLPDAAAQIAISRRPPPTKPDLAAVSDHGSTPPTSGTSVVCYNHSDE